MSSTSTAPDELAVSAELRAAMAELAHLKDEKIRRGLRFRQAVRQAAYRELGADGFGEFETPILGPWINEYAVGSISATTPSGEQLWLAQSPQVYKQMLIAAGYRRYYQFAHCFREEEREPGRTDYLREFIQLDIEMETADLDAIIAMAERLMVAICTAVG